MSKRTMAMVIGLVVAACGVAIAGGAPSAVQREVARIFGSKARIEHERQGGVDYYEAARRTELEAVFTGDGKLHQIEIEIPLSLVPAPAMQAGRKAIGVAPKEAAVVIRGGVALYQLEGRISKKAEREAIVTADGKLQSTADEEGEGDQDDED